MSKVVIGRIAPIMRGEWNKSYPYERYDVVYYKGVTYISEMDEPNVNHNPLGTVDKYWRVVAQRGGDGINFTEIGKIYNDY